MWLFLMATYYTILWIYEGVLVWLLLPVFSQKSKKGLSFGLPSLGLYWPNQSLMEKISSKKPK